MNSSQHIKKELYLRVKEQVKSHLIKEDPEVLRLQKAMDRLTEANWGRISGSVFEKRIRQAKIVFWGDFHGVRQFQRTVIKTWEKIWTESQPREFALGLECLPIEKQKWVDQFLNHEISETDFLEKVKWEQVWGFPWDHYRPLFLLAREKGFDILALNDIRADATLNAREKKAIRKIREYLSEKPQATLWVLFGEYHLLPSRLPKLIKPIEKKIQVVLQNSDPLYFRFIPRGSGVAPSFLSLKDNYLCLQNVAPWIKWQSYLLLLETQLEYDLDEGLEVSDHVIQVAKTLADEMQWKFQAHWFQTFRTDDHALWQKMRQEDLGTRRLMERFLQEELSFMSFKGGWSYLSRLSVNEVGALAFLILWQHNHHHLAWPQSKTLQRSDWMQLIWIFSFAYFGSKLLNPHRRTPALFEIQEYAKRASHPFERQAARLVVHHILQERTGRQENLFESTPSDRVRFLALSWRSGLLGEKIYKAFSEGRINRETLKVFLKKSPAQKHLPEIWQSLEEVLGED